MHIDFNLRPSTKTDDETLNCTKSRVFFDLLNKVRIEMFCLFEIQHQISVCKS